MFTVFGPILLVQIVLIAVVVFVLKKVLELQLIEIALRNFEAWPVDEEVTAPQFISVIVYKSLKSSKKQRILKTALNKFGPQTKVNFTVDKNLLGGMVINVGDKKIQYGLRERLKECGVLK